MNDCELVVGLAEGTGVVATTDIKVALFRFKRFGRVAQKKLGFC